MISEIIKNRRSVFPNQFNGELIDDQLVWALLENANYAPSHRKTNPWRFQVFTGEKVLSHLGEQMAKAYEETTAADQIKQLKHKKIGAKPNLCSHVIAICMQRDEAERIPEWEEICAVACAVQNLWLTAQELGLAGYWSSPNTINSSTIRSFLHLDESERCLGWFYLGKTDQPIPKIDKGDIKEKVDWRV